MRYIGWTAIGAVFGGGVAGVLGRWAWRRRGRRRAQQQVAKAAEDDAERCLAVGGRGASPCPFDVEVETAPMLPVAAEPAERPERREPPSAEPKVHRAPRPKTVQVTEPTPAARGTGSAAASVHSLPPSTASAASAAFAQPPAPEEITRAIDVLTQALRAQAGALPAAGRALLPATEAAPTYRETYGETYRETYRATYRATYREQDGGVCPDPPEYRSEWRGFGSSASTSASTSAASRDSATGARPLRAPGGPRNPRTPRTPRTPRKPAKR